MSNARRGKSVTSENKGGDASSLVRRASAYLTARGRHRRVVRVSCVVGAVVACVVCLVLMRPGISVTGDSPAASAVTASASSEQLVSQKVGATVYADKTMDKLATDEDPAATDSIMVEGELPEGATVKAYRTDVSDRLTSAGVDTTTDKVTAYGIDLYHADGTTFEPTGSTTEKVHVAVDGVTASTDPTTVSVWYVPDDTETDPEKVDCTIDTDGKVTFEVSHFSTYAVTVSPETSTASDTTAATTNDTETTEDVSDDALASTPVLAASNDTDSTAGLNSDRKTYTTVDSKAAGITLNLFDYSAGTDPSRDNTSSDDLESNNKAKDPRKEGINNVTGTTLFFIKNTTYNKSDNLSPNYFCYNHNTSAAQGIVNNVLDKYGYPTLSDGGLSLAYLFDDSNITGKTNYPDVNHLFTMTSDGYYYFNSADRFAKYNKTGNLAGTFTVTASNNIGFFPFNSQTDAKDHFFGLTMESYFYYPKGGLVNGNHMVYEFSGDDDVWVYIDDALVLDIGGIHGAVSGSIDFATKEIHIDTANDGQPAVIQAYRTNGTACAKTIIGQDSTLDAVYSAAGIGTFDSSENSRHKIKVFYLERGSGASNCKIKTNIITPTTSIPVSKVWADGNATHAGDSVKVQLYADGKTYGDPIELSVNNDWKYTFTNLPKCKYDTNSNTGKDYNIDGTKIDYVVQEVSYTTGNITYNCDSSGAYTPASILFGDTLLDNAQSVITNFRIQKVDESGTALTGATFSLYKATEDGNGKWVVDGSQIDGDKTTDTGGYIAMNNLDAGDYLIYEKTAPTGYLLSKTPWHLHIERSGSPSSSDDSSLAAVMTLYKTTDGKDTGEVKIDNGTFQLADEPDTTTVSVKKVWWDKSGIEIADTSKLPQVVQVELHRVYSADGASVPTSDEVCTDVDSSGNPTKWGAVSKNPTAHEFKLSHSDSADSSWKLTWSSLKKLNSSGDAYSYYVKESLPAGYKVTYSTDSDRTGSDPTSAIASGDITITNREAYTLPNTGGGGTGPLRGGGLAIVAIALGSLVARALYRRSKERGDASSDTS